MFDPLTAELEKLATAAPSGATLVRLEQLRDEPLTSAQRMLAARAWEDRAACYAQAGFVTAQVDATTPPSTLPAGGGLPVELLETELALMLRRTDRAMTCQLHLARRYVEATPTLLGHFARGDAQYGHLFALADLTATLTDDQARQVDAAIADRACTMTVASFRRLARKTVAAVDPDALRRRHAAAKKRVGVELRPDEDGMAWLRAYLTAADAIAAMAALNAKADESRSEDDPRSHGQRQVDALLDALASEGEAVVNDNDSTDGETADSGAAETPPTLKRGRRVLRRRRADIGVLISWQDLLSLRDGTATLDRYGPVPAQMIREMLTDPHSQTTLRRIVYDELTGDLHDYATTSYTPDTRMRDLINLRDLTCRYPGCTRPAAACDIDHCLDHDCGGPTSVYNCSLLCRTHHNHKTHDGHSYQRVDPDTGEILWTTTLGFTYRQTHPPTAPTDPSPATPPASDHHLAERPSATMNRRLNGCKAPDGVRGHRAKL